VHECTGEEKMRKVRVIESYTTAFRDPLKAKSGEVLTLGKRDDEWPGWIMCTNGEGKSGWTPETFLQIEGTQATMLRDYDATELTVSQGEILTVEIEESGWFLCVNESGKRGWIPKRNAEEIAIGQNRSSKDCADTNPESNSCRDSRGEIP
jgi:uncharacterized protein YgiM (DUF1202 family)